MLVQTDEYYYDSDDSDCDEEGDYDEDYDLEEGDESVEAVSPLFFYIMVCCLVPLPRLSCGFLGLCLVILFKEVD